MNANRPREVDERGNCSKCGGTHFGTGWYCTSAPTPESAAKEQPGEQSYDDGDPAKWPPIGPAAAPDVAGMVKRLRLLPVLISECEGPRWEDFPQDQREGISRETAYSLGHAAGVLNAVQVAKPEVDALAALIEKLGQQAAFVLFQAVERLLYDYDNCGELSQHNLDFARCCLKNAPMQTRKLKTMEALLNRWHSSATQNDIPDLAELIKDTEREIL